MSSSTLRLQNDKNNVTTMRIATSCDGSYVATITTDERCLWNEFALEKLERELRSAKMLKRAFKVLLSGGNVSTIVEALIGLGFKEEESFGLERVFEFKYPKVDTNLLKAKRKKDVKAT